MRLMFLGDIVGKSGREAVMENLHVEISNLKIKYKEKDGIAFFIHLEHFVFQNCNESWDPISTAANDNFHQVLRH